MKPLVWRQRARFNRPFCLSEQQKLQIYKPEVVRSADIIDDSKEQKTENGDSRAHGQSRHVGAAELSPGSLK